jgi:tRNA G18 (ribose-2'-O)-methylase SpoU
MFAMPTFIRVDDISDQRVDVFRNVRDKDLRGHGKLFMAESEMVVRRLLRTPQRIHSLLLSPNVVERLQEELTAIRPEVPVFVAGIDAMTAIAGFHIHRGALAAGVRPTSAELKLDAALPHLRGVNRACILVAEGLTNVDNMGGLFRNAAAFEVDGILLDPRCCDPLYRKAIRVSMGHALSIPYAISDNWPADLQRLREEWGFSIVAAETSEVAPNAQPLYDWKPAQRVAIVLGNEANGIAPDTLKQCNQVVEIPMGAQVPSLNVAVASAVVLYERARSIAASSPQSAAAPAIL